MLPASPRAGSFNSGGQPQGHAIQAEVLPAPVLGVQANKSLMAMEIGECIYAYNIIPKEYGMEVRKGYYLFSDIDDNAEVRTIMVYRDGTNTKRFCATPVGIYDITAGGTISAGSPDYTWPTPGGDAGFCSYHFYSNSAGPHLLVSDEVNGYVRYDDTSGWVVGGVTGPDNGDDDLVHVMEFKERIWFVERDTGRAWYLPAGSLTGAATEFEFGNKFPKGGYLRVLYNWTIDGGDGPDDYLIIVGDAGDVSAYQGTDPASIETFQRVGNWYVGDLPIGRRIGSNFGGEFVLLCGGGLLSITKLLRGGQLGENTLYQTYNIARLIRNVLASYRTDDGWHVTMHPKENLLIITSPEAVYNLQFVMNLTTQGWAMSRGVPALCSTVYEDELYFGDRSGNIWIQSGDTDAADVNGDDGADIEWSMLQSYQSMGSPGMNKQMHFIRPLFLSSGVPGYVTQARYDFDLGEIFESPSAPILQGSLWGVGLWDQAIWGGELTLDYELVGTKGMGRHVAVAIKGTSSSLTQYVGCDVMWKQGGPL